MGLEAPKTKNTATLQDRYDLQGCGFVVYASVTVCLFGIRLQGNRMKLREKIVYFV